MKLYTFWREFSSLVQNMNIYNIMYYLYQKNTKSSFIKAIMHSFLKHVSKHPTWKIFKRGVKWCIVVDCYAIFSNLNQPPNSMEIKKCKPHIYNTWFKLHHLKVAHSINSTCCLIDFKTQRMALQIFTQFSSWKFRKKLKILLFLNLMKSWNP